jgi:uncharacterized membrane protein YphA (DoxX/SURF4 family)
MGGRSPFKPRVPGVDLGSCFPLSPRTGCVPEDATVFEAFCKEKLGPLSLRLALGLVCVYHGYLKIMATGGTTWSPGLAVGWQLLIAWGEFFAGLAVLVGFRCRTAAVVALALTGGTMIWWQGWKVLEMPLWHLEPAFMVLLMGLALLFLGAGELSVDGRIGGGVTARPAKKK